MRSKQIRTRARWSPPAGEIRCAGLQLRILGGGLRTFLLLHGLAGSQRYFGAAFDRLADRGRVIVPDLLGFGGSPRPAEGSYGAEAHAQALAEALERIGAPTAIFVGAHSSGIPVALRLAALRPDWVRAIAAFGPPLYRSCEQAREYLARLGPWFRLFALETPWARLVCTCICRHRCVSGRLAQWLRPDLPGPIARDAVEHSWPSYSRSLRRLVIEGESAADLASVRAPVHLIAGDRDELIDWSFLRELAARWPQVRIETWSGGHDLPLSHPERCVQRLERLARDAEDHEISA